MWLRANIFSSQWCSQGVQGIQPAVSSRAKQLVFQVTTLVSGGKNGPFSELNLIEQTYQWDEPAKWLTNWSAEQGWAPWWITMVNDGQSDGESDGFGTGQNRDYLNNMNTHEHPSVSVINESSHVFTQWFNAFTSAYPQGYTMWWGSARFEQVLGASVPRHTRRLAALSAGALLQGMEGPRGPD